MDLPADRHAHPLKHAAADRCPDCAQPHGGGAQCAHCGLHLHGPQAVELWYVAQSLDRLMQRRATLIAALHAAPPLVAAAPARPTAYGRPVATASQPPPPGTPAPTNPYFYGERTGSVLSPPQAAPQPEPRPKAEWSQRRVQNTLLGLGVLLLAIAALIFTVVTWGNMSVVGRAAVLLAVTIAVGAAAPAFKTRRLEATAEALAALAIALLVIDAQGGRQSVPSLARLDGRVYWAAAAAVIAAACAVYATRVQLEIPRLAAVIASQLPGLLIRPVRASWFARAGRPAQAAPPGRDRPHHRRFAHRQRPPLVRTSGR